MEGRAMPVLGGAAKRRELEFVGNGHRPSLQKKEKSFRGVVGLSPGFRFQQRRKSSYDEKFIAAKRLLFGRPLDHHGGARRGFRYSERGRGRAHERDESREQQQPARRY